MQLDLLYAPELYFGYVEFVRVAAIDFVQAAEFTQLLTGFAEFAEDRTVEFHLVDFAGYGGERVIVRIREGVGGIKILVWARGDAQLPRSADIVVDGFEFQVVIEDFDAAV